MNRDCGIETCSGGRAKVRRVGTEVKADESRNEPDERMRVGKK